MRLWEDLGLFPSILLGGAMFLFKEKGKKQADLHSALLYSLCHVSLYFFPFEDKFPVIPLFLFFPSVPDPFITLLNPLMWPFLMLARMGQCLR